MARSRQFGYGPVAGLYALRAGDETIPDSNDRRNIGGLINRREHFYRAAREDSDLTVKYKYADFRHEILVTDAS